MINLLKFLEIFSEKFESIIPDRTNGKILFSIYLEQEEKPDKNTYSEPEFKEKIRFFLKQESTSEREQRQKVEERLQSLLRYHYIERTRDKLIMLTEYSIQLCNLVFNKIQPFLNPSEIEMVLDNAKLTLEANIKDLTSFKHWYDHQFGNLLKPAINTQIAALDLQISALSTQFNLRYKNDNFEDLLTYFTSQMETVIEDRKKLTLAFNRLSDITDILDKTQLNHNSDIEFLRIKMSLNELFEHYRFKLDETGNKITQIKKVATGIFDKLDKRPFYRKLETFLLSILELSDSQKKGNRKDNEVDLYYSVDIVLPEYVKPISIIKDTPGFFIYPELHESFILTKNQKTQPLERDRINIKLATEKSKRRQEQARKIEKWLNDIKGEIKVHGQLDFSAYYLSVLNKEKDLELVIKGTEHILKKLRQEGFIVKSSPEFIFSEIDKNNAIWKIIITSVSLN